MSQIPVGGLIDLFQKMYREHWDYVWGAAREGCVDCSGAFVYSYRQYGKSITHGSNAIARRYVIEILPISQAEPGMAAFKYKKPGQSGYALPDKYKKGGSAYNGDLNDYYHIGLVDTDGENVLNAKSTQAGFSRDPLSKWGCVARLTAVDYGKEPVPMQEMIVTCTPGESVKLRRGKSTSSAVITTIPNGTIVLAGPVEGDWRPVEYQGMNGYMMAKFLMPVCDPAQAGEGGLDAQTIQYLTDARNAAEALFTALNAILNKTA